MSERSETAWRPELFTRALIRAFLGQNVLIRIGGVLLVALLALALGGPFVISHGPTDMVAMSLQPPSAANLLGTDLLGRDVLARTLDAARTSLIVAFCAMALSLMAGAAWGMIAGYNVGSVDLVLMRVLDILQAFPPLLLAVALVAVLGTSTANLIFTMSVLFVPQFARIARSATLLLRRRQFVLAAEVLGVSPLRNLLTHVLPNISTPLIIESTSVITAALLTESALSFLGMGIQPPTPTWGGMIAESTSVMTRAPWLVLAPGSATILVVLAFLLLGDGLRDKFDPKVSG
ncbi:ABC transporter permease [Neorhizobium sp. LjRoot104]|uniref:ABC transporter permease n=1 Tax=Neorhizobium sp. LjRoot104 TaxID=3342254 RepID=UPI003ECF7E34